MFDGSSSSSLCTEVAMACTSAFLALDFFALCIPSSWQNSLTFSNALAIHLCQPTSPGSGRGEEVL